MKNSKFQIPNSKFSVFAGAKKFVDRSQTRRISRGFTLVELLVSISIFVVFLGIVSSSYLSIVRTQRHANQVRKMYSQVRGFMETLAQDVRLGSPDYDCYEQSQDITLCPGDISTALFSDPQHYLVIANKDHTEKTVYRWNVAMNMVQLKKYVQSGQGWVPASDYDSSPVDGENDGFHSLFDSTVKVDNLQFKLYPLKNPYSQLHYAENQYQFQPQVTVLMSVENVSQNIAPFSFDVQTTLSSRVYSRKGD